jgi:1-acyl-sn-glycerol-3-phosphate acyltransferase
MGRIFHSAARLAGRFFLSQCIRTVVLHRRRIFMPGPFVVACTHVSHLEPFVFSCLFDRRIHWLARAEFFSHPLAACLLQGVEAISIDRNAVPVRAIRESIELARRGRIIGIFPEGGVVSGPDLAFRGGPIKAGACVISRRAAVPIVPVVMLGTESLNCVDPWLPMRRGRLWVNIGRPIFPPHDAPSPRAARRRMACALQREFISTYRELCQTCDVDESDVP